MFACILIVDNFLVDDLSIIYAKFFTLNINQTMKIICEA